MLRSVLWCGVDLGLECGRPEMEIILREDDQRLRWVRGSWFSGIHCKC